MTSNRMMWVLVMLVVLTTMAITFGTRDSRSQEKTDGTQSAPTPEKFGYKDRSSYPVADYNETLPADNQQRELRKQANKRYDSQGWVLKNPHPNDSGVGREDELPPAPLIPVTESNLVIVGEITESKAHMSNDKLGVYTEFTVQVKQILKNNAVKTVELPGPVTADRMGGYVRYPSGQKVFYENSTKALPDLRKEYVFFLTNDGHSPNYEILTLYELKDDGIVRLDSGRSFDDFKSATKSTFIDAINNKISQLSRSPK